MRIVTLYVQQGGYIYSVNGARTLKQGVIGEGEIDGFLSENPPGVLNVILPKMELIFRKLEFPFTGAGKIKLVMPQELENILPESPENYHYCFEFFQIDRSKTTVNVYAVKNTVCAFWKNTAKKYNSKVRFYSDALLFHSFLKQYSSEKNHIGIYGLPEYLLVNLTENGILSGSYSYDYKDSETVRTQEILSDVLSRKELAVFVIADADTRKKIEIPAERRKETLFTPQVENRFLFHALIGAYPYKRPMSFRKLRRGKKFPVYEAVILAAFLAATAFLMSPYFRLPAQQRRLDELSKNMNEALLAVCPDVTRIVNPLVQMQEKLRDMKSAGDAVSGYPSVLKIMADVTALFPEDATASIDQFTIAGDTLTISGNTGSLKSLEAIKEKIERSGTFTIASMGTISFDSKNRVAFSITLRITDNE